MSLIEMSEATHAHDNPVQSRVAEDQSAFAKLSIGQLETLDGGESKLLGHLWNRSEDTFIPGPSYINLISLLKLPKPCLLQSGMF